MKKKKIIIISVLAGIILIALVFLYDYLFNSCAWFKLEYDETSATELNIVIGSTEEPIFDDNETVRIETDSSGNTTYIIDGIIYGYIFEEGKSMDTIDMGVIGFDGIPDKDVVIPETVGNIQISRIDKNAFAGQNTIESITINVPMLDIHHDLYTVPDNAFSDCSCLKKIVFTGGRGMNIGKNAFSGCENLESVTFNSYWVYLGAGAFSGCSSLKEICPFDYLVLSDNAFSACTSLTEIDFSCLSSLNYDNIHGILSGCSSVKKIIIPKYCGFVSDFVSWLENEVIDCCPALETIVYCGTEDEWKNVIGDYDLGEIKVEYKPGD